MAATFRLQPFLFPGSEPPAAIGRAGQSFEAFTQHVSQGSDILRSKKFKDFTGSLRFSLDIGRQTPIIFKCFAREECNKRPQGQFIVFGDSIVSLRVRKEE